MSVPGIDVPDHRGRTGLDQVGRDLTGNPGVRRQGRRAPGQRLARAPADDARAAPSRRRRGPPNSARPTTAATAPRCCSTTSTRRTVLLSRQFRFPAYVNGHPDGLLLETAAGLLDDDSPEDAVRREVEEELGVTVGDGPARVRRLDEPGLGDRAAALLRRPVLPRPTAPATGGGVAEEGEDIEVVELAFDEALDMIDDGRIADAKTVMLLQWAALRGPFRS